MKGLAEATLTEEGDGAGAPVRSVAMSWRSSEPSSGARATYSTRTRATPLPLNSSSSAARFETSINATSEMSASGRLRSSGRMIENPRAVSYDNDVAYAPPSVRPVSAYAPVDPRGPSELLLGRGLY